MSRKTLRIRSTVLTTSSASRCWPLALLLLVAQLSFDRHDISVSCPHPPTSRSHNWIGFARRVSGVGFVPAAWSGGLSVAVVVGGVRRRRICEFPRLSARRSRWSLLWSAVLLFRSPACFTSWTTAGCAENSHENIGALERRRLAWLSDLRPDVKLQFWFLPARHRLARRSFIPRLPHQPAVPDQFPARRMDSQAFAKEEIRAGEPNRNPPRKARSNAAHANWKNRRSKLAGGGRNRSGLGADVQPVPEPTVRDLSVPQAKPATAAFPQNHPARTPKLPPLAAPADEVEVIPAKEIVAATTEEILGKKPAEEEPAEENPAEEKSEAAVRRKN